MAKYRKRPIEVEAIRWMGYESIDAMCEFMGIKYLTWMRGELVVKTLEGTMLASPGDWIIKGVKGEFYPCKPDIFEMTYERVE